LANTISIWQEFEPLLERMTERSIDVSYADWRPGDQRVYISDIRKAWRDLDWLPQVGVEAGLQRLYDWVTDHLDLFT
jgi:CDP-paratose 2-epimerase